MGLEEVCSIGDFCFQAEDGIRDLVRSRGLGDVYKRQVPCLTSEAMLVRRWPDSLWQIRRRTRSGAAIEGLSLIHI